MERAELHRQLLGLAHIIRVDLKDKLFAYQINEDALALAQSMTGISRLSDIHDRVFAALGLKKPAQPQQLPLL